MCFLFRVAATPLVLFAGWVVIGLGMGIGLYETGFATLAGLIHYAASDPIDLRAIMPAPAPVIPVFGGGVIKRLLTAFQSGY